MDRPTTPRTRRGIEAVEAALDERDVRERIDETDGSVDRPGNYRLDEVDELGRDGRMAAGTDVYTSDEALDDAAGAIGREVSDDASEDDYDHDRP